MTLTTTKQQVRGYLRISRDPNERRVGVDRQRREVAKLAEGRGLTVGAWHEDNDVSAYSGRARPGFEAMLSDVVAGRVSHLLAWDQDRLARDVGQWEKLIRACQDTGTRVVLVTAGEVDLGTVAGRLTSRIGAAVARHESEHKAERVTAAAKERAARGQTHGRLAYGWRRVQADARGVKVPGAWHDEIDEEQAQIVREMIARVLAGESLNGVTRDLNARGVPSPTGIEWNTGSTRGILLRPMNAGLRQYRGKIIGESIAPALVERETWERLVAVLNDPARRTVNDNRVRYLLTGIARCGVCDGTLRHKNSPKRSAWPTLLCHKGCVSRRMDVVDEYVTEQILDRLTSEDAIELLAQDDSPAIDAAREAAEIQAKLDTLTDDYTDGLLDRAQFKRATERLRPRLEAAKRAARVTSSRVSDVLADLVGPQAAERWEGLPITRRRSAVDALVSVRLLPIGKGTRREVFDPSQVEITWKQGGDA
jgi:DNA invertase Pin-like site-specific DNA recombinase